MQYITVKKQVESFADFNFKTEFDFQENPNIGCPKVVIVSSEKMWRFCDPDWNVVISQLSELYKNVKKNRKSEKPQP